jgi:hypothetical protein
MPSLFGAMSEDRFGSIASVADFPLPGYCRLFGLGSTFHEPNARIYQTFVRWTQPSRAHVGFLGRGDIARPALVAKGQQAT